MLDLENATKLEVMRKTDTREPEWEPIQVGQIKLGDVLRLLDSKGRLILQGRAQTNFHTGFC